MSDSWISIFTYNPADIVNPLYLAAEEYDYYPENIHFISPGIAKPETQEQVQNLIHEIIGYYGTEPEIATYTISSQFDFQETRNQFDNILTTADQTSSISIDLTGQPALLNAFLFYVAAEDDRDYDHIFYCSREPPQNEADFMLNDLNTDYTLHQLGEK